jgi:hypothetical protein
VFDRDLVEDIQSEQSGDLGRLLVSLASGGRDNSQSVDIQLARKEAQELYDVKSFKNIKIITFFCLDLN